MRFYISLIFLTEKKGVVLLWTTNQKLIWFDLLTNTILKTRTFKIEETEMLTTRAIKNNTYISINKEEVNIWGID